MRDNFLEIEVSEAIAPASISAATNGSDIDLAGAEACVFVIAVGTMTAADATTFSIEESSVGGGSGYAAAAAASVLGGDSDTNALLVDQAASGANSTHKLGYIGNKRYVRLVCTDPGTGSLIGAVAVRERQRHIGTLA